MDAAKIRAWWSHRQGLDGRLQGKSSSEVLEQTGWMRSVGGAGPYLGLHARAGIGREALDRDVADLKIHELPAARGCTYVVSESDFALALKVGEGFSYEPDMKTARKLGVTDREIDALCDAVLKAVAKSPKDPDEIRTATGNASRNLGPEGTKKGVSTTLPLALGRLQEEGRIRRVPVNGRLDQQRYRYIIWKPNPLAALKLSKEEAATKLARRYFQWIGPATLAECQAFLGFTVGATKKAVEPLGLVGFDNAGDPRLMLPQDREELASFTIPAKPQYVLVSSIDGITLLRREIKGLLAPEDLDRPMFTGKEYASGSALKDLPSHAIFDRGRLVGLWEYDPETESIAWTSFIPKNKQLTDAVERTEAFIRADLGDARSFSLDSPKSRVPRIEALRKGVGA